MSSLTIAMRTADRAPKKNYLGATVRSLLSSGLAPADLHLVFTDPDTRWADGELGGLRVNVNVPALRRSPNANGIAQVAVLDAAPADWLLMLEDDVEVCADFRGSVLRWLDAHARPDVHVYRFCAFGEPMEVRGETATYPLREQRGSQAIALRAEDARHFAWWATERLLSWRPADAPFQNQPLTGFDKLVGYWALAMWPSSVGLVSEPHFVRHIGRESSLHSRGVLNHGRFAGTDWAYAPEAVAS